MSMPGSESKDQTASPPGCTLDHIVIAARSLGEGARHVEQRLGVAPQPGGEHARMGTHNLLLRLGETLYLEVIAINAAAPTPVRPRWFDLDRRAVNAEPALWTWVARCTDIDARLHDSTEPLGNAEPMSRGELQWLISIPENGQRPLDGVGPTLIEWQCEPHPAQRLIDHGLSLQELEIFHPDPARVERLFAALNLSGPLRISRAAAPGLRAQINTPAGPRQL